METSPTTQTVQSYQRNVAPVQEAVTEPASNLPAVIMLCATVLISSLVYPAIAVTVFTATAAGYSMTKLRFKTTQPLEAVEVPKTKRGYHRRLKVNSFQSKPVILKY